MFPGAISEADKADALGFLGDLASDAPARLDKDVAVKGKYVFTNEVLKNIAKDLEEYTVKDYIDPRFDLVDANENVIHLNADGKITINASTSSIDINSDGYKVTLKQNAANGDTAGGTTSDNSAAFKNVYSSGKLKIKKTVKGDAGDKDKISPTDPTDKSGNGTGNYANGNGTDNRDNNVDTGSEDNKNLPLAFLMTFILGLGTVYFSFRRVRFNGKKAK